MIGAEFEASLNVRPKNQTQRRPPYEIYDAVAVPAGASGKTHRGSQQGNCTGHEEVQRRDEESRCSGIGRRASRHFQGIPAESVWRETNRDRRAVYRGQGSDRRLLADSGEFDGRSPRVGQALPAPGEWLDGGSPGLRKHRLPSGTTNEKGWSVVLPDLRKNIAPDFSNVSIASSIVRRTKSGRSDQFRSTRWQRVGTKIQD